MLWVFLAISSHFFWALGNLGDKHVLSNRVKNPYVYLVWLVMFGIISLLLIPFTTFYIPDKTSFLWLALAGALYFYGGLPYVKAMQIEEPTRINIWWNFIPIYSFLIGWIFLGERFSGTQLLAFVILLSGAFLASLHSKGKKFVFSKAVWLMVICGLAFALYAIIFHRVTQTLPFVLGFIWINIFMIIFSFTLLLGKKYRKDFVLEYKKASKGLLVVVFAISLLETLGVFFNQWALSLGSAALVFAMEGFQVIFVFTIAVLLSIFFPKVIKEETDKKNIILKLIALLLMVAGILILAFS